jgi:hypothetical protein
MSLETIERRGYIAARNSDGERAACARRRARAPNEGGTPADPRFSAVRDRLEWPVARSAARVLLRAGSQARAMIDSI